MGRQLVGRGVGGEGHPRFARLDGGAAHPVLPAPFHPEAAVQVGDQFPAPHRAQKRAGLPRLHAQERQRLRVAIRGPGGDRAGHPAAAARGVALHDRQSGALVPDPGQSVQRRLEADARHRRRRPHRARAQPHPQRHGEPRLRPGRGGSGGGEPERRRDVFPGEAAVLHRGRVDLQLRPGRGAQLLGVQLGRAPVLLQSPHRPRPAGKRAECRLQRHARGGAHPRCLEDDRESGGELECRRALGGDGAGERPGPHRPGALSERRSNPRPYSQQPDAGHGRVDSTATSLTGWAARVYLNKQKGNWFSNSAIGVIAPQFDVHDLGFLWRTGVVNMHVGAGHDWTKPGKVFRYAELGGAVFRNYDWDGNINWSGVFQFGTLQLLNYHQFNWDLAYNPWTVNNRRTRGGPLTLNPPGYQVDLGWQSDSRKAWVINFQSGTYQAESDRNWYLSPSVDFRPASNVLLSVGPNLFRELTPVQYVGTYADPAATATFGNRYVFGTLHQTELSAGIRLNWTYSPALSLQVYAQPLISAGRYGDFKDVARPRTFDFNVYGRDAGTITRAPDR